MMALSSRDRLRLLDEYTEGFIALAEDDGFDVSSPNRLRAVLARHSIEDVERMYDACCRFGIGAILEAI